MRLREAVNGEPGVSLVHRYYSMARLLFPISVRLYLKTAVTMHYRFHLFYYNGIENN